MYRLTVAAALVFGLALPAHAADADSSSIVPDSTGIVPVTIVSTSDIAPKRPAALPVLYGSLAGLQAYDIYSTRQALSLGAREANPLMTSVAGSTSGLVAAKVASTSAMVVVAEHLWRTNHRPAAIMTMIVCNGIMTAVAMNNARVLQQQR
jgi:hypothetical protein